MADFVYYADGKNMFISLGGHKLRFVRVPNEKKVADDQLLTAIGIPNAWTNKNMQLVQQAAVASADEPIIFLTKDELNVELPMFGKSWWALGFYQGKLHYASEVKISFSNDLEKLEVEDNIPVKDESDNQTNS